MKDGSRSTMTASGEQFVMIAGTSATLGLCADSLGFKMPWLLIKTVHGILVRDQDAFGWMMSIVGAMSPRYLHAVIKVGDVTTAITVKMRGFAVWFAEVRINY